MVLKFNYKIMDKFKTKHYIIYDPFLKTLKNRFETF